jgi:hypothetical protein
MLGNGPAVHPRQPCQQPPDERRHPPPRLDPGKPGTYPQHQLIEFMPPAIQVYAEASGHRTIFCSPHNSGSSGDGRVASTTTTTTTTTTAAPHDHEVSLEY